MAERQRALPPWMARRGDAAGGKEPPRSSRRNTAARAAFYCMNERELVEAAASCLTDAGCEGAALRTHQQDVVKKREEPATSEMTTKPATVEESSDCGDDLESTYVSETDLDVTEAETVPYARSPQHPGCEGHGRQVSADAEKRKVLQSEMKDDDALRLVREIFFA